MSEPGEPRAFDDPDAGERAEALHYVGRRLAIWTVPLGLIAVLLTALGIPWWVSFGAMALVLAAVVFEIGL